MLVIALIAALFVVSAVAFYLRVRIHLGRQPFGSDVFIHLHRSGLFRMHGGFPDRDERMLIRSDGSRLDFPPVFYKFLSLLSDRQLKQFMYLISPFIDVLHVLALFLVTAVLTANSLLALVAAAVYAVTPLTVSQAGTLTERVLGAFLLSFAMVSLIWFALYGDLVFFAAFFAFGSLILLTHKMTTQTLYFTVLLFGVFLQNPLILLSVPALAVFTAVVTKGYYLRLFKGHLTMIRFWFNRPRYGAKKQDIRLLVAKLFFYNPFIVVLAVQLAAVLYLGIALSQLIWLFVFWVTATWAFALFTSTVKPLMCFGEGERYLQFNAFPIALLAAYFHFYFFLDSLLMTALLALGFAVSIVAVLISQSRQLARSKQLVFGSELKKVMRKLKGLKGKNVIAFPYALMRVALYSADKNIVEQMSAADSMGLAEFYPVLTMPLRSIISKYQLDYILAAKSYDEIKKITTLANSKKVRKLMETENFLLYDVSALK
ncbi:hypothetical protein ACFLQ2_04600 [archaeon]